MITNTTGFLLSQRKNGMFVIFIKGLSQNGDRQPRNLEAVPVLGSALRRFPFACSEKLKVDLRKPDVLSRACF
jgi:hypothetical protein